MSNDTSNAKATPATSLLAQLQPRAGGWGAQWRGCALDSAFQPVLSITHQRVVGYEALLRVTDATGHAVAPPDLFASADGAEAQQLDELARCLHLANFVEQGIDTGWIFLNTLPRSARAADPAQAAIDGLCRHFDFPHERVVIEVLEQRGGDEHSSFVDERPSAGGRDFLVALDDFGAGFSNFDRVWRYRPDIVKLDRSLVTRAASGENHVAFIAELISILHHAGTMVLAEGVETEAQLMVLMQADVDLVQGFWFGEPQASVREAGAAAPALAQSMWQRFAQYQRSTEIIEQINFGALSHTMLVGARVLTGGGTLEAAAAAIFGDGGSHAQRVFAADEHGEQHAPSIAAPGVGPPARLAPFYPDTDSNWSRREYFRRALAAPGRVAVMGPHYSLNDGELCYTAAIALDFGGATHVLCADFPPEHGPRERPSRQQNGRRA
ncbi:diguanylate phosphodiesterase [Paraburkholderia unamae]|uniref:sensor domain-containing phosphodiesterase n=1 Tax=Paraburkholderia unamae TaxID=219649 RepID=UPI000DC4101C|nr:EAL domain-containing protein [Paraburkholderia unamae]RAR56228.1 diguanylate phosphodiesterase [Paraburkholderia unamae]